MEKHLENLKWSPRMVSHLGCVKGCLDYLGMDVSDAWIYGATGHAFIINICERNVCPSGPTAWNTHMIFELGRNIGYNCVNGVVAKKTGNDFIMKQEEARDGLIRSLDGGLPCYGWGLEQAEFYVITGYDDTGVYFNGPGIEGSDAGPKPWDELVNDDTGILEVYGIEKGQAVDDIVTVKEALEFALKHADDPGDWVFSDYRSGTAGFDIWIETVEKGEADSLGMGYNAAVWAECRAYGLKFLDEAKGRLDAALAPLFDAAIDSYFPVVDELSSVVSLFPLIPPEDGLSETDRFGQAQEHLKQAREAEAAALESLGYIVRAL